MIRTGIGRAAVDLRLAIGTTRHEIAIILAAGVVLASAGVALGKTDSGPGLAMLIIALVAAVALVYTYSPVTATILMLVASFFRTSVRVPGLPAEPFVLAFAGMIGAAAFGVLAWRFKVPRVGRLELLMATYLAWNVVSMLIPHDLPATDNASQPIVVWRFILTGVAVPFTLYVVGRTFFVTDIAIKAVLWTAAGFGLVSALASIGQQSGIPALNWPKTGAVPADGWSNRAVGVFSQPVVNGLVLIIGYAVCLYIGARLATRIWQRVLVYLTAALCMIGVYLTYTRMVWLAFAITLVVGAWLARGFRLGFVLPLTAAPLLIAINWATLSSSDRAKGGVGSVNEVDDRLNIAATALWAIRERPLAGWGISRFTMVNTYYHQQWSWEVPWYRGWGTSSHENELGIAAEVGLIGLALWLLVLVIIARRLIRMLHATSAQPAIRAPGRPGNHELNVLALLAFLMWFTAGLTNDLRFFDFPNALVMLLVGAAAGRQEREQAAAPPTLEVVTATLGTRAQLEPAP